MVVYLYTSFQLETAEASKPTKPTKTAQSFTFHSHLEFEFFWHLEISQSTVHPSLQGREAAVAPGVDLGPCRQQHPADLRAAVVARRPVQRGVAGSVLRSHGAGHRPQDVADPPEVTAARRQEDVVVASEGHGPPREGTGRAAEATTETQKIVEHVECFLSFFESTTKCIDVY